MLKYRGVLVLSIILALSSAGCGMGNNHLKTNEYQAHPVKRLQDQAQIRTYTAFNKNVSDKITNDVSSVSGVRKATVIVYDSEAIVGINVKNGVKTWRVEQKAIQVVKNSRPGYIVHVTADNNLYARIESIRTQMELHPNRDFSGDIRILIHDIDRKVTQPTPTPAPAHWHKHIPTPTQTPNHGHTSTSNHGHTSTSNHGHTPTPTPEHKNTH
jgi:hypothetical protein